LEAAVFYFLAATTIGSGILFMTSKKIVHSVFYCFILFMAVAGLYLLLEAPFLAAAQIFIYGGAVTVLILFVVMVTVTDIHGKLRHNQSALGLLIVVFFGSVLIFAIQATKWPVAKTVAKTGDKSFENLMDRLAETLFKVYYFPFEVAGVLLLAALVGAIYLAREKE